MRTTCLGTVAGLLLATLVACGGDNDDTSNNNQSTTGTQAAGGQGGQGAAGGSSAAPSPAAQFVPAPSGACPEFVNGDVTFSPAGIAPRKVKISIGDNPTAQDGPLVFYWHGAGGNPNEASYILGADTIAAIKALGGIVVAPYHDPAAGQFPWFLTTGGGAEDDLLVADEVLGCALEKVGIDLRRIHSFGMSAGALQTAQMSYRRSGYLASVLLFSGGRLGTPPQQEDQNKFAAMIMHGGDSDIMLVNFKTLSEAYYNDLVGKGHFAFICDHGKGHTVPPGLGGSSWQFLSDHPYGVAPSPYAVGLPQGFPGYCAVN